jgi:hypothetical protein
MTMPTGLFNPIGIGKGMEDESGDPEFDLEN